MQDNRLSTTHPLRLAALLAGASLLLAVTLPGCGSKPTSPGEKLVPLTLKSQGSAVSSVRMLAPVSAIAPVTGETDPIDVTFSKALLLVRDVRFKLADTDDGDQDTTGTGDDSELTFGVAEGDSIPDDSDDDDGEGMVIFRGPFLIDLLSHASEELDTKMVPVGVYRRVQGHLRALHAGDGVATPELASMVGSTVWLTGTIGGEGGGPFSFLARIDNEFQIRGAFTVEAETPATGFITFDLSKWLQDRDGHFLDPRSEVNLYAIKSAIRHSIKVRMDEDHDGEMDDE